MTITCHPDCGNGAYLFVEPNEKKEVRALTDFFDLRSALVDIQNLAKEIREKNEKNGGSNGTQLLSKAKAMNILRRHFNSKKAPKGLSFSRLLGVLDGYKSKDVAHDPNHHTKNAYPTLFVAGMHFQDPYNYDIERVKRCIIHYSARDGRIYPFCTYNSGPYYRERVEESISMPLGVYKSQADMGMVSSQLPENEALRLRVGAPLQTLPGSAPKEAHGSCGTGCGCE